LADTGGDAIRSVGSLGANAMSNGFSRGFEDEADRVGVRYAFEGWYEADQAPGLWRRFGEKYKDGSGVTFVFGSHSQSKDRARNMEAEVRKNYQPGTDRPSRVEPEPEPTPQLTPTPASKPRG
jgi:predicted Zn-dependent protease